MTTHLQRVVANLARENLLSQTYLAPMMLPVKVNLLNGSLFKANGRPRNNKQNVHCLSGGAILLTGGVDSSFLSSIEALDPSRGQHQLTCPELPELLQANYNQLGMNDKDGKPVVCGGSISEDTTLCQVYKNGSWMVAPYSLLQHHRWGATFRLNDGRYFIFGAGSSER